MTLSHFFLDAMTRATTQPDREFAATSAQRESTRVLHQEIEEELTCMQLVAAEAAQVDRWRNFRFGMPCDARHGTLKK